MNYPLLIFCCLIFFFPGMCESVGYWTKQWKKPNINAWMFGKLISKVLKTSFIFEGAWFNFLSSFFLKLPLRKFTLFFSFWCMISPFNMKGSYYKLYSFWQTPSPVSLPLSVTFHGSNLLIFQLPVYIQIFL